MGGVAEMGASVNPVIDLGDMARGMAAVCVFCVHGLESGSVGWGVWGGRG